MTGLDLNNNTCPNCDVVFNALNENAINSSSSSSNNVIIVIIIVLIISIAV